MEVLASMDRYALRLLRRLPTRYFRFAVKFWAASSGRRIGSLAADTAFWVVFSLPWLILAIASTIGAVARLSGPALSEAIRHDAEVAIVQLVGVDVATQYANPAFEQVFNQGLRGLGIVGYLVAFYSGSRAVRSFINGIRMMSGGGAEPSQVRSRLRALVLYVVGILLFVLAVSTVTVGTDQVAVWTGRGDGIFQVVDVVLLVCAGTVYLWSIFHFAMVPRLGWRRDLPASIATLIVGALCVWFVAWYANGVASRSSIGALVVAPFVAMLTAYVAVLAALMIALASAILNNRDVLNFEFGPRERYHRLQTLDLEDRNRVGMPVDSADETGP